VKIALVVVTEKNIDFLSIPTGGLSLYQRMVSEILECGADRVLLLDPAGNLQSGPEEIYSPIQVKALVEGMGAETILLLNGDVYLHPDGLKPILQSAPLDTPMATPVDFFKQGSNLWVASLWSPGLFAEGIHSLSRGEFLGTPKSPKSYVGSTMVYPLDSFDPAGFLGYLLTHLRKPTDGLVSRHINRKCSLFLTKYLVPFPIHPHVITLALLLLVSLPCYFLWKATYAGIIMASFIYQLQSILDGVDGELARLKLKQSKMGSYLDTLCDRVFDISFIFFLGRALSILKGVPIWYLMGIASAVISTLFTMRSFYVLYRSAGNGTFHVFGEGLQAAAGGLSPALGKLFRLLDVLTKRDMRILGFLIFSLAGLAHIPFLIFALKDSLRIVMIVSFRGGLKNYRNYSRGRTGIA